MKRFYKTILALIFNSMFFIFNCFSQQAPGIEWQKCLGGSDWQQSYNILELSGKNYLVSGFSFPANNGNVTGCIDEQDCWVVKLDSIGNIIWQKCYGGSDNEVPLQMLETFDGNFLFTGFTNSSDYDVNCNHQYFDSTSGIWMNSDDIWVVKIDSSSGGILWSKCLGGSGGDGAADMIQTSDGGFLIGGGTGSVDGDVTGRIDTIPYYYDCWLIKLDSVGNIVWQKCFGGTDNDGIQAIIETANSFYFASTTSSNDGDVSGNHGGTDFWVVKIDSLGNIIWQKCFGGPLSEIPTRMTAAPNGDIIVTGRTHGNGGDVSGYNGGPNDVWVIRIDSTGNLIWQKCLGGSLNENGHQVNLFSDGSILISVTTTSNDGDVSGNHSLNGSDTDVWLVKLDANGNIIWQGCYGGSLSEYVRDFKINSNSEITFCGMAQSNDFDVSGNHGGGDFWVVKLAPDTTTSIVQLPNSSIAIEVFPNPVKDKLNVTINNKEFSEIILYDITSRKIIQQEFINSVSLNTEQLAKGLYLYEVRDKNGLCKKGKVVKD